MLPHCAAHMLRTISLHFFRAPLNGCRFWDGLLVFQRLARFTTSKPPTSILWYATLDIPTFWCDMRFEELWATWPSISLSHKSDPRFVRNWESCEARFPWKSIRNQGAREQTKTENTDRKHTERKHRQKTQTENTDRKHTERKHRQKTQRENTDRKHRQKTHRQKTETRRQKTQRETQTEVLRNTTKYYTILFHTIQHHTLRCTLPLHPLAPLLGQKQPEIDPMSPKYCACHSKSNTVHRFPCTCHGAAIPSDLAAAPTSAPARTKTTRNRSNVTKYCACHSKITLQLHFPW